MKTLAPACLTSHSTFAPAASMICLVDSTTSGPMPSPGMSVTSVFPAGVVWNCINSPPHGRTSRPTA